MADSAVNYTVLRVTVILLLKILKDFSNHYIFLQVCPPTKTSHKFGWSEPLYPFSVKNRGCNGNEYDFQSKVQTL